jgi:hypothetical protein
VYLWGGIKRVHMSGGGRGCTGLHGGEGVRIYMGGGKAGARFWEEEEDARVWGRNGSWGGRGYTGRMMHI